LGRAYDPRPANAEGFYADLFGWKAVTELAAENPYTTFKLGEEMVAGMMGMPDAVPAEVPPYRSVYFTVADCAVIEEIVADMGGQVYVPTMTIDVGKFASFADPQGATFNIVEYAE